MKPLIRYDFHLPLIVKDEKGQEYTLEEIPCAVDIRITFWGIPGNVSGPPETCYPPEGPEWEYEDCYIDVGEAVPGKGWESKYVRAPEDIKKRMLDYLNDTDKEDDDICQKIEDEKASQYEPDWI